MYLAIPQKLFSVNLSLRGSQAPPGSHRFRNNAALAVRPTGTMRLNFGHVTSCVIKNSFEKSTSLPLRCFPLVLAQFAWKVAIAHSVARPNVKLASIALCLSIRLGRGQRVCYKSSGVYGDFKTNATAPDAYTIS
jgi:hypothetical protein